MMTKESLQHLLDAMPSCSKTLYRKEEVLPQMLALQREIVRLAYGENYPGLEYLKLIDVENHLSQLSESLDGAAAKQVIEFRRQSKEVCNLIKAEISGARGEEKAFSSLERIRGKHIILKNVSLEHEKQKSELDAVVITRKGITIVEVKNTRRDIFIDENGDYFRTGEYSRWDSNILNKLQEKRSLLRAALNNTRFADLSIMEVVVFTNNRIEVHNKCSDVRTCFLSELPYVVSEYQFVPGLREEDFEAVAEAIDSARTEDAYPLNFDAQEFKYCFASLLSELKLSKTAGEELPRAHTPKSGKLKRIRRPRVLRSRLSAKTMDLFGRIAAVSLAMIKA